eukprot:TRINITY_DN3416_c0_g1_i2.p1 TRINITY_DN3416_c0_g1~~TRINITY_DN3416_c0_g1_i2.p1  ORF type:complete len:183 (+),score=17.41 TRINITY_DN3416_c0_g1_i2:289-837(+)
MLWTIVLLGHFPAVMAKVQDEIDSVMHTNPTHEDLIQSLPYLTQVIQESLRLKPTFGGMVTRETLTPNEEWAGCVVPQGTKMEISIIANHRNPRTWKNPLQFDPERFASSAPPVDPFAYFPFGAGRRSCIGKHFAMQEMLLTLAYMYSAFTLTPERSSLEEVYTMPVLRPKDPVRMRVTART